MFIRPTLHEHDLVLVPCRDANGYPGASENDSDGTCTGGRFLEHYWMDKEQVHAVLSEAFHEMSYMEYNP